MAVYDGNKLAASEGLLEVARLCAMAALKAPKVARTEIKTKIVTGDDLWPVVDLLDILGEGSAFVRGDGITMRRALESGNPPVLLLIGTDATSSDLNWNCGACGFDSCAEFNAYTRENSGLGNICVGPSCAWKVFDHGVALDWAAATAWQNNVENRLQASTGACGYFLGYIEGCSLCIGISLGPLADLVYYNRPDLRDQFTEDDILQVLQRTVPPIFQGFAGDGLPKFKHSPNWLADWRFVRIDKLPEVEAKAASIVERAMSYIAEFQAKRQKTES